LTIGGTTTLATTVAGSDILLDTQANNFGGTVTFGGAQTNIRDIGLRNLNSGAAIPALAGVTNLRNLTLTFDNAPIALPSLTANGNLTATAGGTITQTGALTIAGITTLARNQRYHPDQRGKQFEHGQHHQWEQRRADRCQFTGVWSLHDERRPDSKRRTKCRRHHDTGGRGKRHHLEHCGQ
jgi:hypothetical protein